MARGNAPVPTVQQVKDMIPAHLFEHSIAQSLYHLSMDIVQACTLWFLATYIDTIPTHFPSLWWAPYVLWPVMWWVLGVVLTGWWVLAHECGHGGFSQYRMLNDAVGFVLHSFLLVPYWSWAITHGQHHKHTNLVGGDTVFVPVTKSNWMKNSPGLQDWLNGTFLPSVAGVVVMLTIGWPAYLIANVTGLELEFAQSKNKNKANQSTHHFNPMSHYFSESDRGLVLMSDVGVFAMLGLVSWAGMTYGWMEVAKYYIIPYLWVNHWLVLITFLQHTHPMIPHFRRSSWNFVKGAASTVDRSYGWVLDHFMHHIQDSHVAHHMFSTMPFYNAVKATPYIKKALGPLYFEDHTSFYKAAMYSWVNCQYVDDNGDVLPYKSDSPLAEGTGSQRRKSMGH